MTRKTLEHVLEDIVARAEENESVTVESWVREYPEYADDIREFVSELSLQKRLAEGSEIDVNTSQLAERALTDMRAELVRREADSFSGVVAQARTLKLRLDVVAESLDANVPFLDGLDKREIALETIPVAFVEALAARIRVSTSKLIEWLSQSAPVKTSFGAVGLTWRRASVRNFESTWKKCGLASDALSVWVSSGPRCKRRISG